MAYWAAAALVLGTGLKAYGQYRNKLAEIHMRNYQAKVAENNSLLANMEADLKQEQGRTDVFRYRMAVARLLSKQKTGFVASGLDISEGTPVEVMAGTAAVGETDAQTIRRNSLLAVWRLRNEAEGYDSQSGLLQAESKSVRHNLWPTIAGTLLGGASQASASSGGLTFNSNKTGVS